MTPPSRGRKVVIKEKAACHYQSQVSLPLSIEAILNAPHPSFLSSLENFTRSTLPEDISATENHRKRYDENPAVIQRATKETLSGK